MGFGLRACVLRLVNVRLGLEVVNADLGDVLFRSAQTDTVVILPSLLLPPWMQPYLNTQVRMQQHLELKVLATLVLHLQRRPQPFLAERDTVHQTKLVRPRLAELIAEHRMGQPKIELDRVVSLFPVLAERLGRGLAQELPG